MTGVPFGFGKIVFLSHVNSSDMPLFPGDPPVEIRTEATCLERGFYFQYVGMGEQSGTHWAAPSHFHEQEASAHELKAEDFFHPAVVIDVRDAARTDVDLEVSVEHLEAFERAHGRMPDGSLVCLHTGFDQHWADPAAYLNVSNDGTPQHPGFGPDAVRWLIKHRAVGGLGTDALGIDRGNDASYLANRLLLGSHRIHLENLCGLLQMPPLGGWIIVGGLRNLHGSGSPATVFGLVP